jgi:endonuclease/exonuclease/phosphatase family metal-dependent hydrolase
VVRVVSWNLFHGRAVPPAGRPLLHEFASALAGWEWDVALLQEVPPWWPPLLAHACGAEAVVARTSRNAGLVLRRVVASRRPDLLKSNGGGCNAILVRPPLRIDAHATRRLRIRPERRVLHAVRVGGLVGSGGEDHVVWPGGGDLSSSGGVSLSGGVRSWKGGVSPEGRVPSSGGVSSSEGGGGTGPVLPAGAWIGNVHTQRGGWDGGPGAALPLADLGLALRTLERWAGREDVPLLLGGDLNLPRTLVEDALPAAWRRIATSEPDHVLGRGLVADGHSSRPPRGTLSDHAPLAVTLARDLAVRPPGDPASTMGA